MATKNVGKIAIRAVPDIKGFRAELQAKLKGLRNVDVEVKVRLHKDSLAGARGQIKALENTIGLDVRLRRLTTDVVEARREFRDKLAKVMADTPVHVKVNLDLQESRLSVIKKRVTDMVKELDGKSITIHADIKGEDLRKIKDQVEDALPEKDFFDKLHDRQMTALRESMDKANTRLNRWLRDQNLAVQMAVEIPRHLIEEAHQDLRSIKEKWDKANIVFEAVVQSLMARLDLQWLTRPRTIDLFVRINKASLVSVATALSALSGGRLIGNIAKDYWEFFRDLDKNLPSLALITTGIVGLTGALFGSVSSIVSFGAGLAKIFPLLLMLPGLIMGTVAAIGVMVVAWRDVGRELEPLKGDMEELGDIMSQSYWSEARQPIIDLIKNLMPQMRTAFAGAARAMGGFTGALADSFGKEFANGRFESIFATMEEGFRILQGGTDGFAGAIVNMGQIAGRYFPRLARWIVRVADRFDNWLTAISTDGRLDAWMNDGIESLYALWDGLMAGGQVLRGLWTAAEDAGATGMFGFRDQMQAWERLVNSASSQAALSDWFEGGRLAAEGLGDGIEAIFAGLKRTSPLVRDVFASSGDAMRELGELVGDIFGNDDFMGGLRDLMDGVTRAFEDLRPAMEPVAEFLGESGTFIGEFATAVAGPLREAAEVILPMLSGVLQELNPLVSGLADALERTIASESFQNVVGDIGTAMGGLIDGFEDSLPNINLLLDRTVSLLETLSPMLSESEGSAETLSFAISSFIGYASLIPMMLESLFKFVTAMVVSLDTGVRLIRITVETLLGMIGGGIMWLGEAIAILWDGIVNWDFASIGERFTNLNIEYGAIFDGIGEAANEEAEFAVDQFNRAWEDFSLSDQAFINAQNQLNEEAAYFHETGRVAGAEWSAGVEDGAYTTSGGAATRVANNMRDAVGAAVVDADSWTYTAGTAATQGFADGVAANAPAVTTAAGTLAPTSARALEGADGYLAPQGNDLTEGLAQGMRASTPYVSAAAANAAQQARSGMGNLWDAGHGIGSSLSQGVAAGIRDSAYRINESAVSAVNQAVRAARGAAQINSPSKVWRDQIGKGFMEGGALGIDQNSHLMERAAERSIHRATPSLPDVSHLGAAVGHQGRGGPLVGELTFVTSGDVRDDMQEVMWELNRLQMGGR